MLLPSLVATLTWTISASIIALLVLLSCGMVDLVEARAISALPRSAPISPPAFLDQKRYNMSFQPRQLEVTMQPQSMLSNSVVGSLANQKLTPKIAEKVDAASLTQQKSLQANVTWKATGVSAKLADYSLDPQWNAHATPQTREYSWTVGWADFAPDGYSRQVISINGQFPGPLIEANEGDTLVVHVTNKLSDPISIHWHGLNQNSSVAADGVPGFSQCPIPPSQTFTYRFKLEQYGSYWYHSHSSVQYTEGLYGPLIIHSKEEAYQRGRDYDDEVVLLLNDWYHERSEVIAQALNSTTGYNGYKAAPPPQSTLINGLGRFDCAKQPLSPTPKTYHCETPLRWPSLTLRSNRRYRFRVINSGSHVMYHIFFDDYDFKVIANDGVDIHPSTQQILPMHNGQRYDAIVVHDESKQEQGDSTSSWLRFRYQRQCIAYQDKAYADGFETRVAIYFDQQDKEEDMEAASIMVGRNDASEPTSTAVQDVLGPNCRDLDDRALVPVTSLTRPNQDSRNVRSFVTNFGVLTAVGTNATLGRFFVNGIIARTHPYRPFLRDVHQGKKVSGDVAFVEFLDDVWVGDIIINNNDTSLVHPYHLHGRFFNIVARGAGVLTVDKWASLDTNKQDAPRRDTLMVAPKSYAVLRLITDTPGVWPMHCHIAWHLSQGFMGGVIVHPQRLQREAWAWPQENEALCRAATEPVDTVTLA